MTPTVRFRDYRPEMPERVERSYVTDIIQQLLALNCKFTGVYMGNVGLSRTRAAYVTFKTEEHKTMFLMKMAHTGQWESI